MAVETRHVSTIPLQSSWAPAEKSMCHRGLWRRNAPGGRHITAVAIYGSPGHRELHCLYYKACAIKTKRHSLQTAFSWADTWSGWWVFSSPEPCPILEAFEQLLQEPQQGEDFIPNTGEVTWRWSNDPQAPTNRAQIGSLFSKELTTIFSWKCVYIEREAADPATGDLNFLVKWCQEEMKDKSAPTGRCWGRDPKGIVYTRSAIARGEWTFFHHVKNIKNAGSCVLPSGLESFGVDPPKWPFPAVFQSPPHGNLVDMTVYRKGHQKAPLFDTDF